MNDNGTHNGSDPILVRVARESPIEELVSRVLGIRHEAGARPEQERLQAIGNANRLAELVAEMREPSVVAGFAISLGDRGEHNLAEHTLDVASDSRQPRDLAWLAACLSRSDLPDRGNPRGTLLSAMIRRRLPRDVADVLRELNDAEQTEMVAKVLAGLVQAQRVQDTIYIVHDLRMCQCNSLARELSRSMAVQLDPPGVADFVLGLRIHEDHTSASDAVDAALGREVGEVADLIRQFFESDRRYADEVLDEAVKRLLPANKLVLASLLQEGLPPAIASEVASAIWSKATLALGLEDNTFVDALGTLAERAGLAGVHRALEEATRAHSIERIAELVKQVHLKNIDRAVDTVFATAVRCRPIIEIDRLADRFRDTAYEDLALRLLNLAIERVDQRDDAGDVAILIDLLLTRQEEMERRGKLNRRNPWRWTNRIPDMVARVARGRDPGRLMELIDGLVRSRRYNEYRETVNKAVTTEFRAADLILLPQVRRADHLPVVLEIISKSVRNPNKVPPAEIPAMIWALRQAGTREDHLTILLEYIGSERHLDGQDVTIALHRAGLEDDAEAVRSGRRKRPVRTPTFFAR